MASSSNSSKVLPKVLVFDLDGCVWRPEMYEMWGGGAPFKSHNDGEYLKDKRGERVELIGDVRSVMNELKTDAKWENTSIAIASCCDEPSWARECIKKFSVGNGFFLRDVFDPNLDEIYKASKSSHLRTIAKKTGVSLKDMIFFDNEYGNCKTVASIGVTVMYTPEGVTRQNFEEALQKFPASGQVLGPKSRGYW